MEGYNLIEIMIVIVIIGIISTLGGNYFVSFLREHRISVQNYYLQREASFALDSLINGRITEINGECTRTGGIISAADYTISPDGSEIELYNENGFIGRIFASPENNPQSLLFDEDDEEDNGNEYRIIPRGSSEAAIPIEDLPYRIETDDPDEPLFQADNNNPDLIYIALKLTQEIEEETGRNLEVKLNSTVMLRN